MGRPRNTTTARRYHLTVDDDVAQRIDKYAASVRRRPATVAAQLLADALERAEREDAADVHELTRARSENEELSRRVAHLRAELSEARATELSLKRQLAGSADSGAQSGHSRFPRWELPVGDLLADHAWWDRWLPRLYELLGTPKGTDSYVGWGQDRGEPAVDSRGYHDLMTFLFPGVHNETGPVTWRSPDYPVVAAKTAPHGEQDDPAATRGPNAWEAVIRHVAEALCALEASGAEGADPYVRLRAKGEIIGPWTDALSYMVGTGAPKLPHRSRGAAAPNLGRIIEGRLRA